MGATFRELEIKTANEKSLRKRFENVQNRDKVYYGTDPYSGAWNNVPGIKIIPYKNVPRWTKKQKNEAFEHLSEVCEKWEEAKAIRTKSGYLVGAWIPT